jgi:hypothetical protein
LVFQINANFFAENLKIVITTSAPDRSYLEVKRYLTLILGQIKTEKAEQSQLYWFKLPNFFAIKKSKGESTLSENT